MTIIHLIHDKKFEKFIKSTFDIGATNNIYCDILNFSNYYNNNIDIIFIHYLSDEVAKLLTSLDTNKIKVVWYLYGHDAFRFTKFTGLFHKKITKQYLLNPNLVGYKFASSYFLKTHFSSLVKKKWDNKLTLKFISNKINYIIPVLPNDFKTFTKKYKTNANFYHLFYLNPLLESKPCFAKGKSLLIGNSATDTNNHLDVFECLNNFSQLKEIVIPLSYGSQKYGNYIVDIASKKFGDKVNLLKKFMPYEDYQNIILSCEFLMMGHIRQQAMGNIVQALYSGVKVFLFENSAAYEFLKKNNFIISKITKDIDFVALTMTQKQHNIDKCLQVFGKEKVQNDVLNLMKIIA